MDFDKELSKFERRNKSSRNAARKKALEVAARRRALAEKKRIDDEKRARDTRKKLALERAAKYMEDCTRILDQNKELVLRLKPISIHGQGDKLSLPPSLLTKLTDFDIFSSGTPLTVRVAVPNESYSFPSSPEINAMLTEEDAEHDDENDDFTKRYMKEISFQFLSWTHAGVIEFTMEEGFVGLPASVAAALLKNESVGRERTADPAAAKGQAGSDDGRMEVDDVGYEEETPGHLAWGAFDVPSCDVEVKLVALPKGNTCVLMPTPDSIERGFDRLPDVKLALEQSLIRTRSTLSVGDEISCWYRGVQFFLDVTDVPSDFDAVCCINTDLTCEFKSPLTDPEPSKAADQPATQPMSNGSTLGGKKQPATQPLSNGSTLGGNNYIAATTAEPVEKIDLSNLIEEPPTDMKKDVCTIVVRGNGANGKRRFHVTSAKMRDVFLFAKTIELGNFNLVTRFPRKVFVSSEMGSKTLAEVGLLEGQELLLIELI